MVDLQSRGEGDAGARCGRDVFKGTAGGDPPRLQQKPCSLTALVVAMIKNAEVRDLRASPGLRPPT